MILDLSENDRILIVSPHPDDESIGCGGLLSKFRDKCDILLVTDGAPNKPGNEERKNTRLSEFKNAAQMCCARNVFYFHICELEIPSNFKKFLDFDYSKYKYIFVPNKYEVVRDHKHTYNSIKKAMKKKHCNAKLLEYEVWTTIRHPNVKLDISDVVDKKSELIKKHQSQIKDLDYVSMILGLNSYRGKSHGCDYAEYFYSADVAFKEKLKKIKKHLKYIIKR